jgi:ketosteroid isomerase-like protein
MEPWEVAARESIRELVARYAHAADRGRFADLAALFAEDGVLALPDGHDARGHDAIVAMLGGAGTDLRGKTGAALVRHHVSSLAIDVESETAARGWAYFLVVTERGPDHWGRYADRFAAADGKWLFAERRVRLDGFAPGSWAAARRGR